MKDSRSIFTDLDSFQKVELEDIRHFFGVEMPSRVRKNDLVCRLKAYIVENPEAWLGRMLERDLRLLELLVSQGPEVPVTIEYADYPSVLEIVKFLRVDDSDDEFRRISIPKELYDIVAPHVGEAIAAGEASGRFELDRVSLGFLSLYGVMPVDFYYDCMAEYWDFSRKMSFDDFIDALYNSPVLKICRMSIEGQPYVVAPQVQSPENILNARERNEDLGMKKFTPQQALEAGEGAPHFVYGLETPQGEEMTRMMSSFGLFGTDARLVAHDVWMNAQMTGDGDSTEDVFNCVNDRQETFEDFEEYDRCMRTVAAYANSLPKWILGGHSSDEANRMAIVLKDGGEDPLADMIARNPLLGLFVPPSPDDEPCPCGSGLSYRFCHGRYKS